MEQTITKICKLSHKQFRAMLKKFRRKKKRQQLAKDKDDKELLEQKNVENSPGYKEREEEMRRNIELYEQFEEKERLRKHKLWLLKEEQAQIEFKRKQKQLEMEKIKREQERKRILEEFEKQQYVENVALEETRKIKSQKEEVLQAALSNLAEDDRPFSNPVAPENYNTITYEGIEREQCMFFSKTGCCRFGDRCSRGHTRPEVSRTIMIKGMYCHFSIGQTASDDYDTDIALEYEDKETYQDFKNFYQDVLPEFKKFGRVIQFKVCSNFEPHLRGNVYVQFDREENAIEAFNNFNGRYYAGKQISCEFTHVKRWKAAICGLYGRKLCPKGINCNFLHVFKNPNDEFWETDQDLPLRDLSRSYHSSRHRDSLKSDRSSHHSSEHRYISSEHRYKYDSRSSRRDSSSSRHDYKSEYRRERNESRRDKYEPKSDRYESGSDRYKSRSDKYESSHYYDDGKTSCSSESEDNNHCSKSEDFKNESSSWHKSKYRDFRRRSRSNSPMEVFSGSSNHTKSKHRKKKSKKNKKHKSSDSES